MILYFFYSLILCGHFNIILIFKKLFIMNPTHSKATTKLPFWIHHRPKTNIPLAHQVVGKKCKLCGSILHLQDNYELCCADCGYVEDTISYTLNYATMTKSPLFNTHGFTKEEKMIINTHRHFNKSKETNRIQQNIVLDVIKHDLCLTSVDIIDVQTILRKVPSLQKLHSRIPSDTIIVGVCRYVLKKRKVLGYLLKFNYKTYVEYDLTKHDYEIIERNIRKYKL